MSKGSAVPVDELVQNNCTDFCKVCRHSVVNMEKHIQTEEHRRWVRRLGQEIIMTRPKMTEARRG